MPTIDVTQIQGYEQMSAEEKIKALESFDMKPDYTGYVKKEMFDKTASEAAEWKKKHNALLTDEQRKAQENADALTSMKAELETLRKEKVTSEHKAKFIALGYDEALATETATALTEGDLTKVFANQKAFLESHDKSLKAEIMKDAPKPPAGGAGGVDYSKAISEAQAIGDMATVAALIRQQQESAFNK